MTTHLPTSSSLTLVPLQLPVDESVSSRAASSFLGGKGWRVAQERGKEGGVKQEYEVK